MPDHTRGTSHPDVLPDLDAMISCIPTTFPPGATRPTPEERYREFLVQVREEIIRLREENQRLKKLLDLATQR